MDDLIRRLAAIDAINKAVTKEAARWSVKELPSIQPDLPRWIPCAVRTPTRNDHKDGMVLVCYDTGLIRFGAYIDGEWVTGEPIAWMPLPEPYEEEQNGKEWPGGAVGPVGTP